MYVEHGFKGLYFTVGDRLKAPRMSCDIDPTVQSCYSDSFTKHACKVILSDAIVRVIAPTGTGLWPSESEVCFEYTTPDLHQAQGAVAAAWFEEEYAIAFIKGLEFLL